jgi:branched-chain amino acid aminotransferase
MSNSLAYLNGRLLPQSEATLPLHDAGFVMGATVTDLCRTVRHRLYRWEDHLARFRLSCHSAHLQQALTDSDLSQNAHELVAHNAGLLRPEDDLALVMFLTPGPVGYYLGEPGGAGDGPPTLGMHTFPLPFVRYTRLFQTGAHLAVSNVRQPPADCVPPHIKQRSRLHWWLADRDVHDRFPGAFALLQDANGHLTETAAANLLVVNDGIVQSPPRGTGLGGISLQVVRELCAELKIPFAERPITIDDAATADEILLTSTPYCVCGVSRFNGEPIPWPGPIFQRILAAWSEQIGLDIRSQIENQVIDNLPSAASSVG